MLWIFQWNYGFSQRKTLQKLFLEMAKVPHLCCRMNTRSLPLALKYSYQILHKSTQCHFELPFWTCVNLFLSI